jgi:hypothetical protein
VVSRPATTAVPGFSLDDMEDRELPAVARAHRASSDARRIALLRDREHWDFLRVRSVVARRDGRFAGYLITVEGRGEWNVREVGAAGGDPEVMADIVRVGSAEAWHAGLRGFYGWLPPSVAVRLRDSGIRSRSRTRAQPMILPLAPGVDVRELASAEHGFIPFQDQF